MTSSSLEFSMTGSSGSRPHGQCAIHSCGAFPSPSFTCRIRWAAHPPPSSSFLSSPQESVYSLPNVHFVPDKKCLVSLAQTKGLTPSERLLLAEVIAAGSK
jgi:hypothetical protein